jgi:hypothetical protein
MRSFPVVLVLALALVLVLVSGCSAETLAPRPTATRAPLTVAQYRAEALALLVDYHRAADRLVLAVQTRSSPAEIATLTDATFRQYDRLEAFGTRPLAPALAAARELWTKMLDRYLAVPRSVQAGQSADVVAQIVKWGKDDEQAWLAAVDRLR